MKPEFARNDLYELHGGLVHFLAHKYTNHAHDYEELVQEGMYALVKAYDSFKWDFGVKFATYASRCINNEILMYLRRKKRNILTNGRSTRLEFVVTVDEDGNNLLVEDISGCESDYTRATVWEFIANQHPRDKTILELALQGLQQSEIGDIVGLSQSYVSRRLKAMGNEYLGGRRRNKLIGGI